MGQVVCKVRRFDRMLARFCYMIVWVRVVQGVYTWVAIVNRVVGWAGGV